MQISKRRINPTLEKQLYQMLYQLVADIKTPFEAESILRESLSQTELTALAKRIAVAYWLTNNRSYTNIKENIKVSSASISDIQRKIKRPGWKLVINKITADEWATRWEGRIKSLLSKKYLL